MARKKNPKNPPKRRVIFLDFDGVLNSLDHLASLDFGDGRDSPHLALDRRQVALLNAMIDLTDAVVVLSTAWREQFSVEQCVEFLRHAGFLGTVVDRTPTLPAVPRGLEVAAWLRTRGRDLESFVVLDDLEQFHNLPGRHVHTATETGLLHRHVDEAVAILRTPLAA